MKISQLISELKEVKKECGDLDVIIDVESIRQNDDEVDCPHPYAGFMSCTGQCYSKYDFDNFPKDYPERKDFSKKDLICII